ncbi:uncharacterized protein LOC129571560 [Sitodiplosis mosellana]|uniref:uncharacterized protein LOC129571560 n=1 Tax=Sitodiplosis mosellana TaxID=263140 RepID=UPI002443C6FD|nr:uncharacterized protein LOC129571560 [Sitodiplosis mosellana]
MQSPTGVGDGESSDGVNGSKRKPETASKDIEQTKKQKSMPFDSNANYGEAKKSDTLFFCDYCTDPNDSSKSFSGTAEEVHAHWLSSHVNESISQPSQCHGIKNEAQQTNTMFYCDHCIDSSDSSELCSGTVAEVYEHWLTSHLNDRIAHPFQFYAVDLAKCFHCAEVGTYHDLVKHHKHQHKSKFFTISDRLNRDRCGICHFKDDNLIEHFRSSHESVSSSKIFNPVFYSEERITELLNINAEKEHRCIECSQTFETHVETYQHFAVAHADQDVNPFVGGQSQPVYLICGFCMKIVAVNQFLHHFKKHSYNFPCSKCAYRSSDLAELVFHERKVHSNDSLNYHCAVFPDWLRNKFHNTKMVFPNGLVLKNFNVLGTKFDDSKLFGVFIEGILDAKKECLEQMMKMNPASSNDGETQKEQISQEGPVAAPSALDATLIAELNKQLCLRHNLYVDGIRSCLKDIGLQNVFLKLCQQLEVNMSASDIKRIEEKNSNGMSVELHRMDLKMMILNRMKTRTIWSNELVQLSEDQTPWKISIIKELTPYYSGIWRKAVELSKRNAIHSLRITDEGLKVTRTPTEAGHTVRSEQELLDYIEKTEHQHE